MTQREAQSLHVKLFGILISYAYAHGYELTWGQALRTQAEANANAASGAGISNSLHLIALAVDVNLFRDGVWLTNSSDHLPLGTFWKTLHPLCRWGGDFVSRPDGNHYSIEWNGVK